ncbi:oligosaccharide flippase family protein [Saccharothrix sp. ST-888]|uniref:oligosaccharide flippase family protein n=1 Tax=Saccharothrix sp. ST-888 TaxID=1427391 RepID=UPI0005ECC876|nr:oligosaccharide flippase family protein [Saccharothrix sp. ST-888]
MSLGAKVRAGARLSLLNTVVIRIGNFAAGVVLARTLLGPREWGLYATGMVALGVLLSANEMGVSLAIIRWDRNIKEFAPTVVTLSVLSSTALYGLLFVAAPATARALGSPDATAMLRVLCFSVVIDGLACVPNQVIAREFRQGARMVLDLLNFLVTTGTTLTLAYTGAGAMSFAWGALAGNLCALVGCAIAVPGVLRPGWNAAEARALVSFGLPLAGASLLVLAMLNVDSVVTGALLGPVSLGFYQLAFNVSSWPVRSISEAARRISFAGFSRVADSREALADAFGRGLGVLMAAAVPPCVLLATLAEPAVETIYGGRWAPAAGALRFLALLGLLRIAYELAYDCLAAAGRRSSLIAVQGWWLAALVPALLVGADRWGITGVGAGHLVVAALLVAPAFGWAMRRAGVSGAVVLRACARPFGGGLLMAAVSLLVHHWSGGTRWGMFAAGAAALAVYVPVVLPMRRLLRSGGAAVAVEPHGERVLAAEGER